VTVVTVIKNTVPFKVKARDYYACVQCGSMEMVQAHHRIPGDGSSMITLCADCHSKEHPDIPRAFFFIKNHQPYWYNKPAASLAREWDVCSRTVIRAAKILDIPTGELSAWDEELLWLHVLSSRERMGKMSQEALSRRPLPSGRKGWTKREIPKAWGNPSGLRCPYCQSTKLRLDGFVRGKQRYFCNNCGTGTIVPKEARKR